MNDQELSVLLIEDNPGDAFLIKFYLEESDSIKYTLTHADEFNKGLELLATERYDIVLCDMNLPDSFGIDTIKDLVTAYPNELVIVLTGLTDETVGIETVKLGAQDFLVKGRFDSKVLNSSIRYAFERFQLSRQLIWYDEIINNYKQKLSSHQPKANTVYFEIDRKDKSINPSTNFTDLFKLNNKKINVEEWIIPFSNSDEIQSCIEKINGSDELNSFEINVDGKEMILEVVAHSTNPNKLSAFIWHD